MKAEILSLGHKKYYGTEVKITYTDSNQEDLISIWVMGNYKPSEREYDVEIDGKFYVIDRDPFNDTEESSTNLTLWEYEICDSHYETETGYKIAQLLVDAINNEKETNEET